MKDVFAVCSVVLFAAGLWLIWIPLVLLFLGSVSGMVAYNLTRKESTNDS